MSRWGAALTCLGFLSLLGAAAPSAPAPTTLPETCEAIPEGEALMRGLVTGQALHDEGTTTLRFADQAYTCDAWPDRITSQGCATEWSYRLTLPVAELSPGTFDLHELGADFGYLMRTTSAPNGGGCSEEECSIHDWGAGDDAVNPGATLEVYSVSAGCITGKLSGLTPLAASMPMPPVNGAFFALACGTAAP